MANKPILHRRDHERGGADPIRLLWDDDTDTDGGGPPPPFEGGYSDAEISFTLTTGSTTPIDPSPIGGTFHLGSTPGVWTLGAGDSSVTTGYTTYTWQVDIDGFATHSGATGTVIIAVEPSLNPAERVEIFNETMADTDSLPFAYSGEFADLTAITLPVAQIFISGVLATTFTGTLTFTWVS